MVWQTPVQTTAPGPWARIHMAPRMRLAKKVIPLNSATFWKEQVIPGRAILCRGRWVMSWFLTRRRRRPE